MHHQAKPTSNNRDNKQKNITNFTKRRVATSNPNRKEEILPKRCRTVEYGGGRWRTMEDGGVRWRMVDDGDKFFVRCSFVRSREGKKRECEK